MNFKDGDRIKVKPHFWWPDGATGVVSFPPEFVKQALEWEVEFIGTQRSMAGNERILTNVWVSFDEPAMDYSDDAHTQVERLALNTWSIYKKEFYKSVNVVRSVHWDSERCASLARKTQN